MVLFAVVMLLFLFSILCFQLFFIGLSSTLFLYEFIAFKGDLRLALIKMEEHKSVTVQVDKAAGKIYVDGVLPNATLCLYHIRGKVIEVKQAREESASFDLPCSGEYVLVITHALSVPVVKQLVIE